MGRRGSGEGSISKRSDGLWMSRISVGDGTRTYFYGKTRMEVAKKMQGALHDVQRGLPTPQERQSFGAYLDS
jgi:integrase